MKDEIWHFFNKKNLNIGNIFWGKLTCVSGLKNMLTDLVVF